MSDNTTTPSTFDERVEQLLAMVRISCQPDEHPLKYILALARAKDYFISEVVHVPTLFKETLVRAITELAVRPDEFRAFLPARLEELPDPTANEIAGCALGAPYTSTLQTQRGFVQYRERVLKGLGVVLVYAKPPENNGVFSAINTPQSLSLTELTRMAIQSSFPKK